MITILHGENTVQSRNQLVELVRQAQSKQHQIQRLDAKQLNIASLELAIGELDLFANPRLIVIEELHSLPRSKKRDQLVEMLAAYSGDLILWEKKTLTAVNLKPFRAAKVVLFKLSSSLFSWLEALEPRTSQKKRQLELTHQAIEQNGDVMCFTMLARQIRLLIQAKDSYPIKGPGFMINKLKTQASQFSIEKLLSIHGHLVELDQKFKTSSLNLSLAQSLDLLILEM
ncbi:MAG: hypothetical protein ACOZAN_01160 [Patescibacteria group bacterium]